mgnify:CR=1 FL=1
MSIFRCVQGLHTCLLLAALIPLAAGEEAAATAFLDRVIALNQVLEPELDEPALRRALAAMAEQVRGSLAKAESPRDRS